jgi:hypothetical protein
VEPDGDGECFGLKSDRVSATDYLNYKPPRTPAPLDTNNISIVLRVDSDPQIRVRSPLPMADSDFSLVAKACSNCAKAKAKCDGMNTGRCHR